MKLKNYWDYLVQGKSLYQMGPQSHRIYLLDLLVKKGVKTLLDVGCGTGPIYELITTAITAGNKQWNLTYKGTDYSEGMIESCKHNFPEGTWEVEDARHLTELDGSWDCVLLMHCLDHLDDYQAAIKEAARVSNKYVLIVLWRGVNYTPGAVNNLNNKNRYGIEPGDPDWEDTHLQDYSWESLEKAFLDADLKLIQKEDGEQINKEGRYNTLFLLQK